MYPLISVITATRNAEKHLYASMESVFSQNYRNIEYIIVDGGSTDGTLKIIKSHRSNKLLTYVSEKDRGIADAFNKGVKMSRGDFIYFLGADDVLTTPHVIKQMMEGIDSKNCMLVCGKVDRIRDAKEYSIIYTSSLCFSRWMLLYKMGLPHQGIFMNKRFFHKYGLFDIHLKYAMDYDLLLRAYHEFPKIILKAVVVAGWREGGVGADKLEEVLDEYDRIRKKNAVAPRWILSIIHRIVKMRYGIF